MFKLRRGCHVSRTLSRIFLFAVILGLLGCASGPPAPTQRELFNTLLNQSIDDVVYRFGLPSGNYQRQDGARMVAFSKTTRYTYTLPGERVAVPSKSVSTVHINGKPVTQTTTTTTYQQQAPTVHTSENHCTLTLLVNKQGKINEWRSQGNGCDYYANKLG